MTILEIWGFAGLLALLPISELRGAIPYLVLRCGQEWLPSMLFGILVNALAGPTALLFLESAHRLLYKASWYRRVFDAFAARKRGKAAEAVERFGWIGLVVFVAIPLPFTGAWTGALGGWLLGVKPTRILVATTLGVVIAGCIVTAVTVFGREAFGFLLGSW